MQNVFAVQQQNPYLLVNNFCEREVLLRAGKDFNTAWNYRFHAVVVILFCLWLSSKKHCSSVWFPEIKTTIEPDGCIIFSGRDRSVCWYLWNQQVAESMCEDRDWLQRCLNILACGPSGNFGFTKTECSLHQDQCFTQSRSLKSTDLRSFEMLECFGYSDLFRVACWSVKLSRNSVSVI